MSGTVACAVQIPRLAEAASARGLRIVATAGHHLPQSLLRPPVQALLLGWQAGCPADRLAELRAQGWNGVVMLLLDGGGTSVAGALDAGADEALALPASAQEIAARLAARLRTAPTPELSLGELAIDRLHRRVTRAGRGIALLPREYALLLHLVQRAGACVSRAELLEAIWGFSFDPGTNVVQVHISRLRAKLDRGFATPMLLTEKGRGYRLVG